VSAPFAPEVSAIIAELRHGLPSALIATDFDGTLSPIVADPSQARPVAGAVESLIELARRGAQVAVVTGRDVETVLELGGLAAIPGVIVSGLHGIQTWRDGRLTSRPEPPGLAVLRQQLPPLLPEGVWLEDKQLSLVVHARRAADSEAALAQVTEQVTALTEEQGLQAHPGKQVIELRIPGVSKASAIADLLGESTSAALFAGDDLGDLPALVAVRQWSERTGRPGLTVAVGAVDELHPVSALQLDGPAQMVQLLQQLLA